MCLSRRVPVDSLGISGARGGRSVHSMIGLLSGLTRALIHVRRAHAAGVLHTVYCTLLHGGLAGGGFVSNLEVLACCIAAVVHDVEHPGSRFPAYCCVSDSWIRLPQIRCEHL